MKKWWAVFCLVCLGARAQLPSLIQPVPLAVKVTTPEQSSRRIEDFLQECFLHPKLQAPLTLSLQSKSLKEVLHILAQQAGFSVVMDDAVGGVVPLLVARGEPIASVLHAVLVGRSSPLGILIVGSVLHIAPKATLVRRARQLLLSGHGVVEHAALALVWLAWTEPLKLRLEAMWHHCVRQHVGSVRTQYFFADDESRRILVQGTPEQVSLFKRLIAAIDVSIPQVRIEARVVIARTDFMTKLGLKAQFLYAGGGLPPTSIGGSVSSVLPWALKTVAGASTGLELPFTFGGAAGFMSTLNVVLNAAEQKNLVRTLLAPQIMSCSGKQATLHEGQSVPIESFAEDAIEGRTRTIRSAQYRDVGVKVQLKPFVFSDGKRVKLDVLVENSHISATSTSTQYPTITTSRIHNTVLLYSGQTVLLGGLTQAEGSAEDSAVPWMSRIPIIGKLFSGSARTQQERRLYVFLQAVLLEHETVGG